MGIFRSYRYSNGIKKLWCQNYHIVQVLSINTKLFVTGQTSTHLVNNSLSWLLCHQISQLGVWVWSDGKGVVLNQLLEPLFIYFVQVWKKNSDFSFCLFKIKCLNQKQFQRHVTSIWAKRLVLHQFGLKGYYYFKLQWKLNKAITLEQN